MTPRHTRSARGGALRGALAWSPARALIAGLIGAAVNSAAIHATEAAGIRAGTGGFARWLFAHANQGLGTSLPTTLTPLGQEAFHTVVGIGSAVIYAALFYRYLPGPRWFRGLSYSQGMWAVQALLVLPWLGQGYFGTAISLSAPVWSWALNALYGVTIGILYAPGRPASGPARGWARGR